MSTSNNEQNMNEGRQDNKEGIVFFGMSQPHAILAGKCGAGKSVLAGDILSQTEGFSDYTKIIEEGPSFAILSKRNA